MTLFKHLIATLLAFENNISCPCVDSDKNLMCYGYWNLGPEPSSLDPFQPCGSEKSGWLPMVRSDTEAENLYPYLWVLVK